MRHTQLITFGLDDAAAAPLHKFAQDRGAALRITRDPKSCASLLRQCAVGVLLLRVGRHLETEFTLLAQSAQEFPAMASVVWCDADQPWLAGLACDLGARSVVHAGPEDEAVRDILGRLLPE